jgi:hypothetical protein
MVVFNLGVAIVWAVSGEQGMSREPWANIHEPWAKKVLLLVWRKSLTTKWKNYEWIETFVQGWQFSNLTLQGQTCNSILNTLSKMWRLKLEFPITGHLRNCTRKWRVGFELLMDIVQLWGNPLYMKCQSFLHHILEKIVGCWIVLGRMRNNRVRPY